MCGDRDVVAQRAPLRYASRVARVLLVDDDPALLDVLSLALTEAGHAVQTAKDGMEAWQALERTGGVHTGAPSPQLAIVDVSMPRLDGFSLVRRVRHLGLTLPILVLTSRDDELDEALGLELGADDYVAKPFSLRVLLARVSVLLRRDEARAQQPQGAQAPLTVGRLSVDGERLEVRWGGTLVTVTVTELKLLEALARRPGVVFSRERLLSLSRGDDSVVGDRLIDTYVRRLRRKLESVDASFDRIETVVGAGYRWRGDLA